jgi:ribA/ribD-fused uncharacterized protein
MAQMIENFNKVGTFVEKLNVVDSVTPLPEYAEHNDFTISGFFGPYRFLSNFWPAEVKYLGMAFPSVEVAYQCAKCANPEDRAQFLTATSGNAKQLGKKIIMRPDWESMRYGIMRDLVFQKFKNDKDLAEKLLDTGGKSLIEANAWKDKYWGVYFKYDSDQKKHVRIGGQNMLGAILMEVRDVLGNP